MAKKTVAVGRNKVSSPPPKLYRWPGESGAPRHTVPYAQHQTNRGLKKTTLARPPAGSYDVDIDAQERASTRGIENTRLDYDTAKERASSDFGTGQGDLQREYGESLSDLLKQRTQGQEDYQTNLQTIGRNFQRLGNNQAQQGRRAGLSGGFAAQAQRKRGINEALERAPVDTNFDRFMADSTQAETRLGEAKERGVGQLGRDYERGDEDLSTSLERAEREYTSFGMDAAAARQAQFGGKLPTAWVPTGKPKPKAADPRAAFQRSQQAAARAHARAVARAKRKKV